MQRLGFASPSRIMAANRDAGRNKLKLPTNVTSQMFHVEESDGYQLGKQTALPHFNLHGAKSTSKPYELIHIDVKPINQMTYQDKQYVLLIVDDYTREKTGLFLKHKDEVSTSILRWYNQQVCSRGYKISRIRLDRAGEQTGFSFAELLSTIQARAEYTSADSSASNGVAEKGLRTLMDTVNAMRMDSGLPKSCWGELFQTACFIENRLPTTANANNLSPYEMINHRALDLSVLRRIGCKCYLHIHKTSKRRALDPKAKIGYMLGYSADSKCYRILMDRTSGKVQETSHVVFAERIVLNSLPDHNVSGSTEELTYSPEVEDNDIVDQIVQPMGELLTELPVANLSSNDNKDNEQDDIQMTDDMLDQLVIEDLVLNPNNINTIPVETIIEQFNEPRRSNRIIKPVDIFQPTEQPRTRAILKEAPRNRSKVKHNDDNNTDNNTDNNDEKEVSRVLSTRLKFKEAIKDNRLKHSVREELKSLFNIGCVSLAKLPDREFGIGSTWAHKLKTDAKGEFIRAKSRLAPWGFQQIAGQHYDVDEVASPTLHLESCMILLAITCYLKMHTKLLDVDGAFQIPTNKHVVYMKIPDGMKPIPGMALRLDHSMNGTKQGAFNWHEHADKLLIEINFTATVTDPCLYYRWTNNKLALVGLYVDDFRIAAQEAEELEKIVEHFKTNYAIKDQPPDWWLNLKVEHDMNNGTLKISQETYIKKQLEIFNMKDCKPCKTPAEPNSKLIKTGIDEDNSEALLFPYRELVGALLWISRTCRPEIKYAVIKLTQFANNPNDSHIIAAKRVLRYLSGEPSLGITFTKHDLPLELIVYADSDWAGEPEENDLPMRSTAGYVAFSKGVGPLAWNSTLLPTVSQSTAEAEYKAVGQGAKWLSGASQIFEEIGIKLKKTCVIYSDNQAAIAMAKAKFSGSNTRHIKINHHFIRELISKGDIEVQYCTTAEMIADITTKALPIPAFMKCREGLQVK